MREYVSEMIKRKDLLYYLVQSGLKAEHRNSYLGYFWWLLDPLLNVVVYYFLITVILGRGGTVENFALFLVIGLVAWRWISTTVNTSSKAIMKYASIINQVYMPKSIFPLAFTFTQLFNFGFGLIVIAIFLAVNGIIPGWHVVFLPLIILVQLAALIALSLILSYVTVFIRDMDHLLTHVTRVLFYSSPIIWEGGRLPPEYSWIVDINPIAIIVTAYRDILMYAQIPNIGGLMIIFGASAVTIFFAIRYYSKNEYKIIKAL